MITGAHSIIYSEDAEADRAFLRDVIGFPHVDAGGGWLIFALPPSEVAVHPADKNNVHEFYLTCENIDSFIGDMINKNVSCSTIDEQPWGRLTMVTLPGGGQLGVYEPRHECPS